MRFVIQKVSSASVAVNQEIVGQIQKGYLIFMGVGEADTCALADQYIRKIINLRLFEDENGKTNLSLGDVGGSILLISQFTLYADCRKGNRPSFTQAREPSDAKVLYEYTAKKLREQVPIVQTGIFGASMQVSLVNEGPFTIVLDESLFGKNA